MYTMTEHLGNLHCFSYPLQKTVDPKKHFETFFFFGSHDTIRPRRSCNCWGTHCGSALSTTKCNDCGKDEFFCHVDRWKCVKQDQRCNSDNDCGNWKDEEGCRLQQDMEITLGGKQNCIKGVTATMIAVIGKMNKDAGCNRIYTVLANYILLSICQDVAAVPDFIFPLVIFF